MSENYVNNMGQKGLEEKEEFYSPQNSLIGNISTLQLYDEGNSETAKKLFFDAHSKSPNEREIKPKADSAYKDCKKEDSEYCIIRNERETNDGWLVVSGD